MTLTARRCTVVLLALLAGLLAAPTTSADAAGSATISGTVTRPGGATVPGLTEVYVTRWVPASRRWASQGDRVFVDASGGYTARDLPAGTYRLMFEPSGEDWLSEWWDDAPTLETATDVVVAAGEQRADVDAVLQPAGHLSGRVLDPEGRPVPFALVDAMLSSVGPDGYSRGTDVTSQGYWDIGRLAPGTYRVRFVDDRGSLPTEWWNDSPAFATATDVVVGPGQTVALGDTVLGVPTVLPPAAPGAPVVPAVANAGAPRIKGRAVIGRSLTARPGTWSPAPLTYAYQWYAGGKAVRGATSPRLKLKKAQLGKRVTVQVTASSVGATPATASSRPTAKVVARHTSHGSGARGAATWLPALRR